MSKNGAELVYCRSCKRRHWTHGWTPLESSGWWKDDSFFCPKRKARYVARRHWATGNLQPT